MFAPTPTGGCAGAVSSCLHPTITSARRNVPFAEAHIRRRTERANNAFKFLKSCDGERRKGVKKSQQQLAEEDRSRDSSVASAPRQGRSVTAAGRRRDRSRGRARTKGRSCSLARIQEVPTWADRTKLKPAARHQR
ncbi:hypothetical protein HPB51_013022 [Rhipicephalus microplus]|uniref:Uncharacterized protein n=1 Tax=Rhipicephalus microplus TaxID=6941 RepID=A0A9J6F2X1_RHIMP|nr:hypothetical protein HPB51_013022 [Rhipicephalus microplus]